MRAKAYNKWIALITVVFTLALLVQGIWAQEATPEASDDCVSGPGFWANHPEAWAVTTLTLGSQSYTQAELIAILGGGGDGDASLILARHLIAAKLNVASGASSTVVDSLISAGDALLVGFSGKLPYNVEPSSAAGQSMTALATTLDSFNAGDDDGDCVPTATPESTNESTPEATVEGTLEATPEITPEATPTVRFCDDDDDDDNDNDDGDDDDCDIEITIIIEGPVEAINANIIVIYGFNIELDPNDPLLVVIQVGDIVRIEGNIGENTGTTILIIAVIVVIVDIDVVVSDDGAVWRDEGNCNNPPPPWAPANGWRRRCEQRGGGNGGSGSGS